MWIAHHYPEDYDRCVLIGRTHVCRRCAGAVPGGLPDRSGPGAGRRALARLARRLAARAAARCPAVVEFVAEHLGLDRATTRCLQIGADRAPRRRARASGSTATCTTRPTCSAGGSWWSTAGSAWPPPCWADANLSRRRACRRGALPRIRPWNLRTQPSHGLDPTPVFRLADAYVDAAAALDPGLGHRRRRDRLRRPADRLLARRHRGPRRRWPARPWSSWPRLPRPSRHRRAGGRLAGRAARHRAGA